MAPTLQPPLRDAVGQIDSSAFGTAITLNQGNPMPKNNQNSYAPLCAIRYCTQWTGGKDCDDDI